MPDGTVLTLQSAIVARLRGTAAVTAIVPAADIFDRSTRPERSLCVIVGEDQVVREPLTLADEFVRVYSTLHLWHKAQDFAVVKNLADAIRKAMRGRLVVSGMSVVDMAFESARFLRDPDGEFVHGVVTLNALVREAVS